MLKKIIFLSLALLVFHFSAFSQNISIISKVNEDIITIEIYNLLGRKVLSLADNKYFSGGYQEIIINSEQLVSGIYFYKITSDNLFETKKMVILK